jgi:Zn-finger nucleic acid-binding protein
MLCPRCGVALEPTEVAGQQLSCCPSCEGVLVGRQALLALRSVSPAAHPLLAATPAPDADPAADEEESRPCPRCSRPMHAYPYRGGKTIVESCRRCDTLFLDPGELGRILDEWRHGLEMSDDAREFLQLYREESAFKRVVSAESALSTVGLAALVVFFYLVFGVDEYSGCYGSRAYALPIPLAAAIAVGFYLFYRWRLRREKRSARRELRRVQRQGAQPARADRPAAPAAKPTGPPPAARCPWCNAPVPHGASHCKACDSDIF